MILNLRKVGRALSFETGDSDLMNVNSFEKEKLEACYTMGPQAFDEVCNTCSAPSLA